MALGCSIASFTKWDRKSYYYPDLPKNYQISQYDLPVAGEGTFEFEVAGTIHRLGIIRAHLEEDAGKNQHDSPAGTQVDLNRAGTPLLEIVTRPDLASAEEAYAFCTQLQHLVTFLGVSEASMQKGQMRFEPNVNLLITHDGVEYPTPICEIKNLNSFKAVRDAIDFEVERHRATWEQDHDYTLVNCGRENRGWDDDRGVTVYQRGKEEAHDYRYFPDPDLVPITFDEAELAEIRTTIPELPLARRQRLVETCQLGVDDAWQIIADRSTADLFDAALAAGADARTLGKHFISFWSKHANAAGQAVGDLGVSPAHMAELVNMTSAGRINATAAAKLSSKMLETGTAPGQLVSDLGLEQIQDTAAIEALVDEAIAGNPKAVAIVNERGKKWEKSVGFLQGQVMQKSRGSAAPQIVRRILEQKLGL